jgi:cation diffusion facilitator family transporter
MQARKESARFRSVRSVLASVLVLNLVLASAKIVLGYATGALSILSDGFHSLTDAAANVVGLVGLAAARRPPDADHPYGHRKYETLAASAITVFLVIAAIEVLRRAFDHLTGAIRLPTFSTSSFALMIGTLAINLIVILYESREAKRHASELLLADAVDRRGDLWASLTVVTALVGVHAGLPLLDPLGALVVVALMSHAGYRVAAKTMHILSDRVVISEAAIEQVVMSVPGVIGCHQIRTRGAADHVFLDLHLWLSPDMPLLDAHRLSHVVKDRLMTHYHQLADVLIHIEPAGTEIQA